MLVLSSILSLSFFLLTDTAPTDIYTLSLHDALPIWQTSSSCLTSTRKRPADKRRNVEWEEPVIAQPPQIRIVEGDRKSTRLNSSHPSISYAVFCLKKKKKHRTSTHTNNQPATTKSLV